MGKMKERYKISKAAKVGDVCICPSCKTEFVKTNYQQVFCKSKPGTECKDKYWNTVIPAKRNNLTRISPANAKWQADSLLIHDKVQGYTSEGYRIIDGVAVDKFDDPVYWVDPEDDTHPMDQGDAGDHDRY